MRARVAEQPLGCPMNRRVSAVRGVAEAVVRAGGGCLGGAGSGGELHWPGVRLHFHDRRRPRSCGERDRGELGRCSQPRAGKLRPSCTPLCRDRARDQLGQPLSLEIPGSWLGPSRSCLREPRILREPVTWRCGGPLWAGGGGRQSGSHRWATPF